MQKLEATSPIVFDHLQAFKNMEMKIWFQWNVKNLTRLSSYMKPVPVAVRSKVSGLRPLACSDRGFESHRGGARMFVCCECCVLSGRGLCDELITRPEESYGLWCVVACDLETSRMRRPWPALGRSATEKKKTSIYALYDWSVPNELRQYFIYVHF